MTTIAKVSLSGDVEKAIKETCDIHEAADYALRGTVTVVEANAVLLIFHKWDTAEIRHGGPETHD